MPSKRRYSFLKPREEIPVAIKSQFEICDSTEDMFNYNYLLSYFDWTAEERIDRFIPLVIKIGNLICPLTKYGYLVRTQEVMVSNFNRLNSWAKIKWGEARYQQIFFSEEGIRKSPKFCFMMILSQLAIRMLKRFLRISDPYEKIKDSMAFDWCLSEISQRLGMENYNIKEEVKEILSNGTIKSEETITTTQRIRSDVLLDYNIRRNHATTFPVSILSK